MKEDLTKDDITHLKELIARHDDEALSEIVRGQHPADIADILEELETEEADYLLNFVDEDTAAESIMEMEEEDRLEYLENKPKAEIASQIVEHLDTDDAVDLIKELDEDDRKEVISHINDSEQAEDIRDLLRYDDDTAGSLMRTEMIVVNENWSMNQCVEEMRMQAEDVSEIYNVYVVDDDERLVGILPLKEMIMHSNVPHIKLVMETDPYTVQAQAHVDDVAADFEKYNLVALPVLDSEGKILGIITVDDVMDSVRQTSERDYQHASALSSDVESDDGFLSQLKARLPWLLAGLCGGVLNVVILSLIEVDLKAHIELVFFIPLICALAGMVGIQSSAVVVQGLDSGTLELGDTTKQIGKEVGVSAINALIICILAGLCNVVVNYDDTISNPQFVLLAVPVSVFAVIVASAVLGALAPLILEKFKIDPGRSTGPFITILNDIMAMALYALIISTLLLL